MIYQDQGVYSFVKLSLNLHPVLESEHQPPIVVGCGLLHHCQPEGIVKLSNAILQLMQSEHEPANEVSFGLPLFFLLLEGIHPGLGLFISGHITVVAFGVLLLALRAPGVLLDAPLGQLRHHRDFPQQLVQLCVNGEAVGKVVLHDAAILQQSVLAVQQLTERRQEPNLDVLLHQMRSAAFYLVVELAVALPDNAAVFAVGVPDLGAVVAAAVAADQPGGEYPAAAVAEAHALAPSELGLDNIELMGLDNGLVASLNPILLDLALIDFSLFTEEINRVAFLKECRPLIFLIREDALHHAGSPLFLAGGRWNAISGEGLGNGVAGFSLHEKGVDAADDLGLVLHYLREPVRPLSVAEKLFIGEVDLTVREPLALTPGDVLRQGAALLLGQRGHDGNEQFTLGIEGPDVLLLEVDLHVMLLQLADGGQAVHRVSGKAAHRLGDDEVDFPGEGIGDHLIETSPALCIRARNALIRIDRDKLPLLIALDVPGVVVDLCLITGELLITVGGDAGIPCCPAFLRRDRRGMGMKIDGWGNDRYCSCCWHDFIACPFLAYSLAAAFISGVQLSALERSAHRLTV